MLDFSDTTGPDSVVLSVCLSLSSGLAPPVGCCRGPSAVMVQGALVDGEVF